MGFLLGSPFYGKGYSHDKESDCYGQALDAWLFCFTFSHSGFTSFLVYVYGSPLPCYCQDKKDILEIGSKVLSVEAILD
ncbi:hypothetical protein CEE88_11705 [Lactobacillus crispatus]|nr:hypothetical protein CEE88_11705 [Lactobacillus crispatus]